MELLSLNQVNVNPNNIVYKNSPFLAFVAFLVITAFLGILIVLWIYGRLSSGFVIFSGFFVLMFSIIFFRRFLKTLKPDNWVVRLDDNYMLIKYRSFQNTHLSKDDVQIIRLQYSEISSFSIGKRTRNTPSASGGKRYEFIKYLDLHLNIETYNLNIQLNRERNMKRVSRALHSYVFVTGNNTIRIHWLDTRTAIHPNLKHIANSLVTKGLYQIQNEGLDKNVPVNISDEDRDILDLHENGLHIEAISLARRLYGLNLAEAKSYVQEITELHK
jgi:hypothetical protein